MESLYNVRTVVKAITRKAATARKTTKCTGVAAMGHDMAIIITDTVAATIPILTHRIKRRSHMVFLKVQQPLVQASINNQEASNTAILHATASRAQHHEALQQRWLRHEGMGERTSQTYLGRLMTE